MYMYIYLQRDCQQISGAGSSYPHLKKERGGGRGKGRKGEGGVEWRAGNREGGMGVREGGREREECKGEREREERMKYEGGKGVRIQ